jgi:hypothetical protein
MRSVVRNGEWAARAEPSVAADHLREPVSEAGCASESLLAGAEHLLTLIPGCGSMLGAATSVRRRQDNRRQASGKQRKEPAMQIGEEQQEFEILPEEEQPLVLPEREPQPQPEAAPA